MKNIKTSKKNLTKKGIYKFNANEFIYNNSDPTSNECKNKKYLERCNLRLLQAFLMAR